MTKPTALVTNDDGIDSYFLQVLVGRLQEKFDVIVAAPAKEQSWTGRSMTRRDPVSIKEFPGLTAWIIDGTPTDCVNTFLSP